MFSNLKGLLNYVILAILAFIILFALYTWGALNWVYSSGERAGYVQKFSLKGFVCKTWEGELILVSMPGTQAEKFFFTVKDEEVAKKINTSLSQHVKLFYKEHITIPSTCFGETAFFVHDVQDIKDVKISDH